MTDDMTITERLDNLTASVRKAERAHLICDVMDILIEHAPAIGKAMHDIKVGVGSTRDYALVAIHDLMVLFAYQLGEEEP